MRYVWRGIGVSLVAACALIGAATASASVGLPEAGKCELLEAVGKYLNSGCTEKARKRHGVYQGNYEWSQLSQIEGEPVALDGSFAFETAAGKKIECEALYHESSIALLGPKTTRTPLLIFEGCHSEGTGAGHGCRSNDTAAQAEPEIIDDHAEWREKVIFEENEEEEEIPVGMYPGWPGRLGFIGGKGDPNPSVGVAFKVKRANQLPYPPVNQLLFSPIVCEDEAVGTVWIGGEHRGGNSVIGALTPVDQMSSTYTLTFTESAPGEQTPERFEGKRQDVLQAFIKGHWEPLAFVGRWTFTLEGDTPIEIKAER